MQLRLLLIILYGFPPFGSEQQNSAAIRLNPTAFAFAQQLIKEGRVMPDRMGAWGRDRPSTAQENEFVRVRGLEEYGKWHLGIDHRHGNRSKAHYKFPFGDFKVVHRCGLLGVKARAHEYGYVEIETAAAQLLRMLESTSPTRQKGVD